MISHFYTENHFFIIQILDFSLLHWIYCFYLPNSSFSSVALNIIFYTFALNIIFFYLYKFLILQWKSFFHLSNSSFCTFALNILFLSSKFFIFLYCIEHHFLHFCSKHNFLYLYKFLILQWKSFFHLSNSWFFPFAMNILFLSSKFFIFLYCIEHHFLHFCSKHNFFYLYKFLILQWKSFFHLSNSWFWTFAMKIIFLSFKFLIFPFCTENYFFIFQILDFALLHGKSFFIIQILDFEHLHWIYSFYLPNSSFSSVALNIIFYTFALNIIFFIFTNSWFCNENHFFIFQILHFAMKIIFSSFKFLILNFCNENYFFIFQILDFALLQWKSFFHHSNSWFFPFALNILFLSSKFFIYLCCIEHHFLHFCSKHNFFYLYKFLILQWKSFFHLSNSSFCTFALNILFLSSKFFIFLCCIEHHFLHFCSKHNFFYLYKFLILQWKSFFHLSNSSFCTFALNILFLSSKFFIFLCCIEHHFLHFCSKHNFFYLYKFLILQWKSFFSSFKFLIFPFCNEYIVFIFQILHFPLLHWTSFFTLLL